MPESQLSPPLILTMMGTPMSRSILSISGVEVWWGTASGTLEGPFRVASPPTGALIVADIDGDGNADVVTRSRNAIQIYAGDGNGGFAPPASFPFLEIITS